MLSTCNLLRIVSQMDEMGRRRQMTLHVESDVSRAHISTWRFQTLGGARTRSIPAGGETIENSTEAKAWNSNCRACQRAMVIYTWRSPFIHLTQSKDEDAERSTEGRDETAAITEERLCVATIFGGVRNSVFKAGLRITQMAEQIDPRRG